MEQKKSTPWARMDSCLEDPNVKLYQALEDNNLRQFVDNLCMDDLEINREFAEKEFSTILHLAVSSGKADFVREVLRHKDVNPNHPHRVKKVFPIHVAAENGNLKVLQSLLNAGADANAKMENGSTALHLLAVRSACRWAQEEDRRALRAEFVYCANLLVNWPGTNIDHANNIGVTPLYFAVEKGTAEVAEILLDLGACVTVDVDGQTVEDLLDEKMPELLKGRNLDRNKRRKDEVGNMLFLVLYSESGSPGRFIPMFQEQGEKVSVDADNGTYTFLQYACDQGLHDIADFLLARGADPNLCTSNYRMPPLLIAAHHGYYRIIGLFKTHARTNRNVDFGVVDGIKQENVLHKVIKAESKAYINFEHRNYDNCIALLFNSDPVTKRMIQPIVDGQDQLGNTPLHHAAENGHNEAILNLLRFGANIGVKNSHNLSPINHIPPEIIEEFLDECLDSDGKPSHDDFKLKFRYVFLGPRIRRGGGSNEEQKLLSEEEEAPLEPLPEAEPLWYLSQSLKHQELLTHPVITSFLGLKWRKIRPYYYTNLLFYLTFVTFLTSHLLLLTSDGNPGAISATRIISIVLLILLTVRELFQAMVSFRRYIFDFENCLVIVMIVMLFVLFFGQIPTGLALRHLAGTALLLCWMEMVMVFGRHPKLSTYITMFSTVSKNFLMFLTWYSSLIVAFGLTFFIVLQHPSENQYFGSPSNALLKTIVMSLTGELEFEGIAFGGLVAIFLFLLYIFFIMLVLVNLLNGLAVSDIAEIQKHAEIVSLVSTVELIAYMESMLLGDPFNFFSNWPHIKWLQSLPSLSCLNVFYTLKPVRKLFDTLIGNTQLLQTRLKEKTAVFQPNKSRFEESNPKAADKLQVDFSILRRATDIVVLKEHKMQDSRLASMEKAMKLLADQNNFIIELLGKNN